MICSSYRSAILAAVISCTGVPGYRTVAVAQLDRGRPMPAKLELTESGNQGDHTDEGSGTIAFDIPEQDQGSTTAKSIFEYRINIPPPCVHTKGRLSGSFLITLNAERNYDKLAITVSTNYDYHDRNIHFTISCPDGSSGVWAPAVGGIFDVFDLYVADGSSREHATGGSDFQRAVLRTACPVQLTRRDAMPPLIFSPKPSEEWPLTVLLKTKAEIRALSGEPVVEGRAKIGLTRPVSSYEVKIDQAGELAKFGGGFCFWLNRITVKFPDQEMFLASNYPPSSCEAEAIRKHEDKHYQSYSTIYKKHYKTIEESLRAQSLPTKERPYYVDSDSEGEQIVTRKIRNALEPIWKIIRGEAEDGDKLIDLEYDEVIASCPGWDDF